MPQVARALRPSGEATLLNFRYADELLLALPEVRWKTVKFTKLRFQRFALVALVPGKTPPSEGQTS